MELIKKLQQPPWRTVVPSILLIAAVISSWFIWSTGTSIIDGHHDRRQNGIWISHAWLGADDWFVRHGKTNEISRFRNTENITKALAEIHSGLIHSGRPDNYQGISIYANWVTESNEWRFLKKEFFASE